MIVSIIIPIYNVENYILECLQSVANQTKADGVECILIDDKGTDRSIQLATKFISEYHGSIKFRMVHHSFNKGLSASRNSGIHASQGEFVYFLDSDDTITPDCIELMYSYISKYGDVDLVLGSFYESIEEQQSLSNYSLAEYSDDQRMIKSFLLKYQGDIIPAQSKLIKRQLIDSCGLYFKEGIIHEDNYWTFFLAKYVKTMCFCNKRTYFHRNNPNSITKKINWSKECFAFKTIICDLCQSIDPFLVGCQKEYILDNLQTALNNRYYESELDEKNLIKHLKDQCNILESMLLSMCFALKMSNLRTKVFHLLIRIFKYNN